MDDAGSFLKICSKSTTTSLGLILGRIINSRLFTSALAALECFSIAAKGTMVWSPMNRIDDPPSHLSVVGSPWSHRTQVPSPSNEVWAVTSPLAVVTDFVSKWFGSPSGFLFF